MLVFYGASLMPKITLRCMCVCAYTRLSIPHTSGFLYQAPPIIIADRQLKCSNKNILKTNDTFAFSRNSPRYDVTEFWGKPSVLEDARGHTANRC